MIRRTTPTISDQYTQEQKDLINGQYFEINDVGCTIYQRAEILTRQVEHFKKTGEVLKWTKFFDKDMIKEVTDSLNMDIIRFTNRLKDETVPTKILWTEGKIEELKKILATLDNVVKNNN